MPPPRHIERQDCRRMKPDGAPPHPDQTTSEICDIRDYFFLEASSFFTFFSSFLIFLLTLAKLYHCSPATG